nr:DinB family protein [Granulicella sp. dw_53]
MEWNDITARRWRDFVTANPAVLDVPCDIREATTAGQLLQHVVAVELRYAQRLTGLPETEYSAVAYGTGDELLATHEQAMTLLQGLMADTSFDWTQQMEFVTITMGKMRSSRKTVFVHTLMHGIRHYAQLSTLVRQHGFKPGWPMDYLFVDMMKA